MKGYKQYFSAGKENPDYLKYWLLVVVLVVL